MRRLVMWNLVTLDGHFEGARPWDIDWHGTAWGEDLERFSLEQAKEVGALVFGRVTYEGMAGYWSTAKDATAEFMNEVPKLVFSRTLGRADWNNTRLVSTDAAEEIARLKQEAGKDLFVFGSANLSDTLIRHGLFDEYRICVAPVVLGRGAPLFKSSDTPRYLRLLEGRPLASGAVLLRYAPSAPPSATANA